MPAMKRSKLLQQRPVVFTLLAVASVMSFVGLMTESQKFAADASAHKTGSEVKLAHTSATSATPTRSDDAVRGTLQGKAATTGVTSVTAAAPPCDLMYCPISAALSGGGEAGDAFAAAAEVTVVVGIPTVDTDFGRERRSFQRASWFTYPSVWRGVRGEGPERPSVSLSLMPRYILARHPSHGYEPSAALMDDEAPKHKDIIFFDMKEGKPATGKKPGMAGYWGLEAEVGMSRKAFAWYAYAAVTYPNAQYVMKGDDDIFLRVELYLRSLAILGRIAGGRLYWGPTMMWGAKKGDPRSKFAFVGGMSITLSRSLVSWIATSKRGRVNMGPFLGEAEKPRYKSTNHDHEDVMVGRMFYDANVSHVVVRDRRFHDIHVGANVKPLMPDSVGIHHLKHGADEYAAFRAKFKDADGAVLDVSLKRIGELAETATPVEMRPGVTMYTIERK